MNLLLVEPGEVDGDTVVVADRRATHLREVLGARVGTRVRVGVVGGGVGHAEVVAAAACAFTLRLAIAEPAPPCFPVEVVLAVPRPKVLARVVEALASFAVERIALTNAWRVDKSYLRSPRVAPPALAHAARLGAEQGATTSLPEIVLWERLMRLLDARWPAGAPPAGIALIAHPGGIPLERAIGDRGAEPATLAIGPEGGWIAREVDTFVARGFTPVTLGPAILRVETAIAVALGQLALLRRLATAAPDAPARLQ